MCYKQVNQFKQRKSYNDSNSRVFCISEFTQLMISN